MQLSNNKILITGGATGIGFGLAERFVQEKNTVIICGRRQTALDEAVRKIPALISRQNDLSTVRGRQDLFRWVSEEHPDVNVLVNNAGLQQWMDLDDNNFFERAHEEIITNVEAPVHLVSLFIRLSSINTILNVTSALAFVPRIQVPVYSATKAFFHSFTLSARALLQKRGIEVIEVIPPGLKTDLGGKGLHDDAPPVSDFIETIFKQLKSGKSELTFGYSEALSQLNSEAVMQAFNRMNQIH